MKTTQSAPKKDVRVTIKTVAEHAGVSVPTVSKVLRNAYGVSAKARSRVLASIDQLQYRPSASARGMRGQTYTIGIVMPDVRNPFFPTILEGVEAVLAETPYVTLTGIVGKPGKVVSIVNAMLDRQMDGIIMIGQRLPPEEMKLVASALPTVIVAHHEPDALTFDTVNNDDLLGGQLAADHLLQQGYKNPVMVTITRQDIVRMDVDQLRVEGYRRALAAAGISVPRVVASADMLDDVTATIRHLLEGEDPPDALFGWADYYALEILSAVRALGYRVPEDVGIVGYDNSDPCSYTQNDLTSIDQSGQEIGRRAAQLLLERIGGRTEAVHVVTEPKVVGRGSTGRIPPLDEAAASNGAEFGSPQAI
jgi:DNA-binding LacI/PurR family transcriptional regulator